MPTTGDVLDQHLRCFGENDLDGVVADYSSDAVLFVPDRPLKGPAAIKPFFQAFLAEFAKPGARRFRCVSDTLTVNTHTYCGARKRQTIRTKLLPTLSLCGTERSWRSPLQPRLPRSAERVVQPAA
jgi:ketosteroid isomerase-like protein